MGDEQKRTMISWTQEIENPSESVRGEEQSCRPRHECLRFGTRPVFWEKRSVGNGGKLHGKWGLPATEVITETATSTERKKDAVNKRGLKGLKNISPSKKT